jgi:hypothetical protein
VLCGLLPAQLTHTPHTHMSITTPVHQPSFTSFGFTWPPMLLKMYNVASMTSFNEQLLAPECSIGGWGFKVK